MKKLVAVTTTILIILIAVLSVFMIKGHGSDSSTAKSTLSDQKESLSDKEDTKAAEASKDSDADWVYDGELLHMNKQMKTITYEGRDFKVKFTNPFYEEGSDNYISVIFYDKAHGYLLKSLGEGTDSAFYEAYKTEDGCETWNKCTADVWFDLNGSNHLEMISENEICERFGVSRTPVREAVRRLQEQGFVISVPYSGTQVTLLNLSNIKQMIYMRVAVETMVMRDFVDIATPMEEVRYMIRKQQALIQEKGFEPEQFYRMDAEMHAIWFRATDKMKLWDMIQAQQLHYTRFRMLDFVTETDFTRIIREHTELFELLEKKDIAGLERSLKEHLYYSMKRMKYQIDVEYKDYFEQEE